MPLLGRQVINAMSFTAQGSQLPIQFLLHYLRVGLALSQAHHLSNSQRATVCLPPGRMTPVADFGAGHAATRSAISPTSEICRQPCWATMAVGRLAGGEHLAEGGFGVVWLISHSPPWIAGS